MLGSLLDNMRDEARRRKAYLVEAREEIRVENIDVACNACLLTLLILVACLAITPIFIEWWVPAVPHLAFLPVIAALVAITQLYRSRSATRRHATALCVFVGCTIVGFVIAIDTAGSPSAPSVFAPMTIVALSALFILPVAMSCALSAGLSLVYAVCALTFKDPYIAQFDQLSAIATLTFSACVVHIIMRYRLQIHEAKSHFERLSRYDDLSSVLNKRTLFSLTEQYFADAGEHAPCTLVFIDVDNLKSINDTHGHLVGDAVIGMVGELLRANFRPTDIVGRFGGDEFVVFVHCPLEESVLETKIGRIREGLAQRTEAELGFAATASAGAVIAATGMPKVTDLIRRADTALYQSKNSGKDRLTVHRIGFEAQGAA